LLNALGLKSFGVGQGQVISNPYWIGSSQKWGIKIDKSEKIRVYSSALKVVQSFFSEDA
jgi:hypothetical protein